MGLLTVEGDGEGRAEKGERRRGGRAGIIHVRIREDRRCKPSGGGSEPGEPEQQATRGAPAE